MEITYLHWVFEFCANMNHRYLLRNKKNNKTATKFCRRNRKIEIWHSKKKIYLGIKHLKGSQSAKFNFNYSGKTLILPLNFENCVQKNLSKLVWPFVYESRTQCTLNNF